MFFATTLAFSTSNEEQHFSVFFMVLAMVKLNNYPLVGLEYLFNDSSFRYSLGRNLYH